MSFSSTRWPWPKVISGAPPGGLDVHAQQAAAASAFAPVRRRDYAFLLLFRFALVNLVGVAMLGAAFAQGWIDMIRAADPTHQCTAIFLVFVTGLIICANQAARVSGELNEAASPRPAPTSRAGQYLSLVRECSPEGRPLLVGALRAKLMMRTAVVRHIAGTLVILGLIGTVIGFIVALSGVKPEVATDAQAAAPMISTLIQGMSIALYTTLVGAVLNIWLMVNHHMLVAGTTHLITAIVERGEADVGR